MTFQDGRVELIDRPVPAPGPDEALLRIRKAGICATDLEITKGYMGFAGIMGHEFVAEVADGPDTWIGKRVVGEINCPCRHCAFCSAGMANHCPDRTVLGIVGRDGVFAEYAALPVECLHEVPEAVSDRQAVFVEPLAAAFEILKQVPLQAGREVVVLGDGRLGQLVARVLASRLPEVVLVGKHPAKLSRAQQDRIRPVCLEQFDPPRASRLVVDATGSPAGFALAMRAAGPRGTIVLKSTTALGAEVNLAPLVVDEITVVGSRCGPFPDAIAALATGAVQVADLISRQMPLASGLDALAAAEDPQTVKVLLDVAS
jgi:threonine dehydrogenase-like Zn-dependent dehydrogenase